MRCTLSFGVVLAALSVVETAVAKSSFSIDSTADIKTTAAAIAYDLMALYKGNQSGQIPGILSGPPPQGLYYWGSAGTMWQFLIDYWYYTGDSSYNDVIMHALMWQRGEKDNFMPTNFTNTMGNDDQGIWATAAMAAAERGFPNPPADTKLSWVSMVETVFNEYVERWDTKTCDGGLRWQIIPVNNGYNYKNSVSNGFLFSLSARLARYTGNKTYADWAEKTWNWAEQVSFIDNSTSAVYDGASVETSCKNVNKVQFSMNNAIFVLGASYMYNYTNGDSKWRTRTSGLIDNGVKAFFPKGIAFEASCEKQNRCNLDMTFYKGVTHQWWSVATTLAPFTSEKVLPVLKTSAAAAVKSCNGGSNGRSCQFSWSDGSGGKSGGAGEEFSALAAVTGLLVGEKGGPFTAKSGGGSGSGGVGGNGGDGGDGKKDNTTSSGNGKDSAAGKVGAGVVGLMVVSVGTMLVSVLTL